MKTDYVKNTEEAVQEYLDNCTAEDLVYHHNQACQNMNYADDEIYHNDEEFFNAFFTNAIDAVRAATYGDYNYTHDWVMFDGYANLQSFDYPEDHVDMAIIIEDILERPDEHGIELEEPDEDE